MLLAQRKAFIRQPLTLVQQPANSPTSVTSFANKQQQLREGDHRALDAKRTVACVPHVLIVDAPLKGFNATMRCVWHTGGMLFPVTRLLQLTE
jgi:hypothetical protein